MKVILSQAVEVLSCRYPLLGMGLMEKSIFELDLIIVEIKRIR
jgi:hypothetical protein